MKEDSVGVRNGTGRCIQCLLSGDDAILEVVIAGIKQWR